MKTNKRRLQALEAELSATSDVPPEESLLVLYPDTTDKDRDERSMVHERLKNLREKYGPRVSEKDLVVIRVRYDEGRS